MNIIKQVIEAIKFIINDFKTDIQFIIKVLKGEVDINKKLEELTRDFTVKRFLKENWLLFLCCLLTFLVGFFIAAKHYQNTCNTFILENFWENLTTAGAEGYRLIMENISLP